MGILSSAQAQTQMPLPAQSSTNTPNVRGYWFQAPADFVITGLQVPTDASSGSQSIAVVRLNAAPPAYSATTNAFTTLFLTQNNANSGIQAVNIQIHAGEYIGVLGSRNDITSYCASPTTSSINGIPVTLTRLGMQYPLSSTAPQELWTESGSYIGRIFLYYTVDTTNVPRIAISPGSFMAGPAYPAAGTLNICNTGILDTLQYSIDSVAGGAVVADTAAGRLAAAECRNVQLTFNRSGLAPGNNIIQLIVRHNAWGATNPLSVPCTLFVDSAALPHITLTPGGFHAGPAYPDVQTLQICNTGTVDTLQYSIDSVAGGSVVADTASGLLGAGDCRNVSLTFNRSGLPVGNNIIQLVVRHNSPLSPNPLSVPCTLYVDSASVPHIALTPASFHAGPAYPDVQTLQICNPGTLDTLQYSLNLGSGGILINEAANAIDYIELVNAGVIDVNIGGWRLVWTDNTATSGSYTIPAGTMIRSRRCVQFIELTGTSNDSVFYMGSSLGWVTTTQLSVSLLNSSGAGADFFKTSGDATLPPTGTTWSGTGVTAGYGTYYRSSTDDNNTAADWAGSSSYTPCLPNPGQSFSGGGGGIITADTATGSVAAGQCRTIQLTFDRSGLLPGTNVIPFTVTHNSPLSPNPLAVQCTLVVDSASVPHIALTPGNFNVGPAYPAVRALNICNIGSEDTLQYSIDSVAGGRITVDTASGSLAAGVCRNAQLTFNRTGLLPGSTVIQLIVRHNGPLEPNPISVPCTLFVDSASVPHIALAPASFRIGPADPTLQTLQICNTGNDDTLQYTVNSVAGRVSPDTATGRLGGGDCRNVQLTFNRTGLQPGVTVFQFTVNHNSPLSTNPLSVPCTLVVDSTTMTYSIPSMAVTLYTGDTALRYVTLQNTGSSILMDTVIKISQGSPVSGGIILINEVCNATDYIELLNSGDSDLDIGGWRLVWTDNTASSGSYTIPAGTIIRARRCVLFTESTGTGSDSVIYMGNSIGWVTTTDLSVSLLNSSGVGVDFFKTSGDATLPPAGTSWLGAGVTAGNQSYYRDTIVDNNTAADWVISSSYTYCLPNPGQNFSGSMIPGYISAVQDSFHINPGQSTVIPFTYDASLLYTGGFYIDTFEIIQNSRNVPSPITVICTLTVISNIPELIPYTPDPTTNRRPTLQWHPVASASVYTVEASLTPAFSTLEIMQQTADTSFGVLADLPLGMIYWRVRCDLNTRYSLTDNFFIQNDSIPILIPLVPDTTGQRPNVLFSWHPSAGAVSYRIRVYDITSGTPTAVILTDVADTFYVYALTLPVAKYMWTVSSTIDTSRSAYPDTFWVDASPVVPGGKEQILPAVYALTVHAAAGRLKITCAIPKQSVAATAAVTIDLFDMRGKLVRVLFNGMLTAGYHQLPVTTGALANGVYYCRMRAGGIQKTAALHLMR